MTIDSLIMPSVREAAIRSGSSDLLDHWQMSSAERICLVSVLQALNPKTTIEIGTAQGGSLAVIAQHAEHVYSLDIDPQCEARLKDRFANVTFRCGPSQETIPGVLEEIEARGGELQFVLIDGDHSREGVRRDIELILQYQPRRPLVILLHDSFNPFCRMGMRDANWAANPHVHSVELDFIPGGTLGMPGQPPEMWGGLGVALLAPAPRSEPLVVGERNGVLFEEMLPRSAHAEYFGFSPHVCGPGRSLYSTFAEMSDKEIRGWVKGERGGRLAGEPPGFVEIRARLLPRLHEWEARKVRVAVFGKGEHTRALLGLVPELDSLVIAFIDRRGGGTFLGRPCLKPGEFTAECADVVVYSSRAFEREMMEGLASHNVEHVLLYD